MARHVLFGATECLAILDAMREHVPSAQMSIRAAGLVSVWCHSKAAHAVVLMSALSGLTATEAAQTIAAGRLKSRDLVEELIERVESNAHLNAFIALDAPTIRADADRADEKIARGEALGPLHGVPIALKDNIDATGYATTAATPALRHHLPATDAPIVSALRRAGSIVFGKTMLHELAFGITCNNPAFGPCRNPYNPDMIAGGSSGGTAVAVAARLTTAGIGSDTGGSVRVPAGLCGIAGLRPTLKRWSQTGIVPIASTRDTAGPMARSIADLELLDFAVTGEATSNEPASLRGLRLGVPRDYFWSDLETETADACNQMLDKLSDAGVELSEINIEDIAALDAAVSFVVALYEPLADIPKYLSASGSSITLKDVVDAIASPDVRATMQSIVDPNTRVPRASYYQAMNEFRPQLIKTYKNYFSQTRVEAVLFPTTPLTARPLGDDETVQLGDVRVPTFPTFIRNTDPGSNAGIPGVTVPVGLSPKGLPIGLSLDGPTGSDKRLLRIAAAIEGIAPPTPAPIK